MQKLTHQTHSFDEFTLDLTRGCLLHAQEEIKLRPKSFEVLRYLVENNGRLTVRAPAGGGTRDKTWTADGNVGSGVMAEGATQDVGTETSGQSKQVSVSGGGLVTLGVARTAIVNTSATQITNISAAVTPGTPIFLSAFSGSIVFAEGSGIHLAGTKPMTVPSGATACFVRNDLLGAWKFVGRSF